MFVGDLFASKQSPSGGAFGLTCSCTIGAATRTFASRSSRTALTRHQGGPADAQARGPSTDEVERFGAVVRMLYTVCDVDQGRTSEERQQLADKLYESLVD